LLFAAVQHCLAGYEQEISKAAEAHQAAKAKGYQPEYGIIEFSDNDKIKSIVEKPKVEEAPSNFAGLGRYVVKNEIFGELENLSTGANGEYQFTDAMLNLMNKQDFYACKFNGTYYDIGNQLGYIKANIAFALERDDIKDDLKEYLKTIV